MKAILVSVRERILHLYEQDKSTADIAASLGYCGAAVRRVCALPHGHFQTTTMIAAVLARPQSN